MCISCAAFQATEQDKINWVPLCEDSLIYDTLNQQNFHPLDAKKKIITAGRLSVAAKPEDIKKVLKFAKDAKKLINKKQDLTYMVAIELLKGIKDSQSKRLIAVGWIVLGDSIDSFAVDTVIKPCDIVILNHVLDDLIKEIEKTLAMVELLDA